MRRDCRFAMLIAVPTVIAASAVVCAANPIKLTFAYGWLSDPGRGVIAKKLVAEFNAAHPDINVNLVQPTGNPDTWLAARVASGTQPNVWVNGPEYLQRYADRLVDIGQYLKNDGRYNAVFNDLVPGARPLVLHNGKLLGIPINTQLPLVSYINRAVFNEKGVVPPQDGWTWDDLLADAEKLGSMNGSGKVSQWGAGTLLPFYWWMYSLTLDEGAPDYSADGKTFLPNPEGSAAALQYVDGLIYDHQQSVFPNMNALKAFEQGKVGIYFDGSYRLPAIRQSGVDFQAAPILHGPVRAAVHAANHMMIAFKSGDTKTDVAAAEFVDWFTSPDQAAQYDVTWGDLPARLSVIQNANYQPMLQGPNGAAVQEMLTYLNDVWPQVTPVTLFSDWAALITKAIKNQTPPKTAIAQMKQALQPRFDQWYAKK